MRPVPPWLRTALTAGAWAAVLSGLGLGLMSWALSGSLLAPVNATSHFFYGPEAAARGGWLGGPTVVGAAVHVAASLFWAAVLALGLAWLARPGRPWSPAALLAAGLAVGAAAGVVDYGILPRILSPGWHLVLPAWAVAAGFALLGAGLGIGAVMARGALEPGPFRA